MRSPKNNGSFRPQLEALEDRTVPTGFGAIGDSLTLPYFGRAVTAHNWVEELVDLRGVNFGGLSSTSGGGSYALGATGYAYDWGGPNTYGALAGAAPALAQQISAGQVDLALVELGAHDFIWYPNPQGPAPYEDAGNTSHWILGDIYSGAMSGAALQSYTSQVLANLGQIYDALSAAGNARLVAFGIPDFSVVPQLAVLNAANPAGVQRYRAAIAAANAQYEVLANQRGIPLIDFRGLSQTIASGSPVVIGGVSLDVHSFSNPADPHNYFADSQHPGTVASGLTANAFIQAVDNAYGAGIAPLSDQELLQYAGITPPTSGPTYFDVSQFVIYPTPTLDQLSATSAPQGNGNMTISVSGANFLTSSAVQWNGEALPTAFVSSTELRATIPAEDFSQPGVFPVRVVNPTPGGGPSNAQNFEVIRTVQIDIKPGGASSINLAAQGVIPVTIYGSATFNVAGVDISSAVFAGAKAFHSSMQDLNGDGFLDLVLQFRIQDTNLLATYRNLLAAADAAGGNQFAGALDADVSTRQSAALTLTAKSTQGDQIEGIDTADLFLAGDALRQVVKQLAASGRI